MSEGRRQADSQTGRQAGVLSILVFSICAIIRSGNRCDGDSHDFLFGNAFLDGCFRKLNVLALCRWAAATIPPRRDVRAFPEGS